MVLNLLPLSRSFSLWCAGSLPWKLAAFLVWWGSFWSHDDYFWDKWDLLLLVLILLVLVYFTSHADRQNSTSTSKLSPTTPTKPSRTRWRPSWPILASPRAISFLLAFSPIPTTAIVHCVKMALPAALTQASSSPCAGTASYRSPRIHLKGTWKW